MLTIGFAFLRWARKSRQLEDEGAPRNRLCCIRGWAGSI